MTESQRQTLIDLLRSTPEPTSMSITELRTMFDRTGTITNPPKDVVLEKTKIGGVYAEWSATPDADPASVLLYLHGGGFQFGSAASHRGLVTQLGSMAGVRTLALEYRLAPENRFPCQIEDAVAAYRDLLDGGLDPARIVIAGDSAGGGLAIAMLVAARNAALPMPAASLCISPWVDMTLRGESMQIKASLDPVVSSSELSRMASLVATDHERWDPRASPILADLAGLPPVLIQVGSHEVLLDDATRLAARLGYSDVAVRLEVWPKMPHVWHLYSGILSEGWDALSQAADFVRDRIR